MGYKSPTVDRSGNSSAPDSATPPGQLLLRYHGRDLPLTKPELVIGRSSECDVVFDSSLVSRRHARLVLEAGRVFIEDLGSRNGVLVNSRTVSGRIKLKPGDTIGVGDEVLELVLAPPGSERERRITVNRNHAPTLANLPALNDDLESKAVPDEFTRRATALELLAGVVDKALALGHGDEAERMLQLHMRRVLEQAESGGVVTNEVATTACSFAVKLASSTGKPMWLDYCIRLYATMKKPMPLELVDEFYGLLRKVNGLDRNLLREYVALLRRNAAQFGPAERFALQRIEGLERLASL